MGVGSPSRYAEQVIPLDMVLEAVDMYNGCTDTMEKMVNETYFANENTGLFGEVWKHAENCADSTTIEPKDKDLTRAHIQAICVYASHYKNFYNTFNKHIRTNRSIYSTNFQFHSLHFWLTSALQILNKNKTCVKSYRRTNDRFAGNVSEIIRFGLFASSSFNQTLIRFGKNTCFEIQTCAGAYLKNYPSLRDSEQEVLIPPYEKFNITEGTDRPDAGGLPGCQVLHKLENVGLLSNVNCTAARAASSAAASLLLTFLVAVSLSFCP
ncbi:ecto-ADP-ribosyltransferase 4-like [Channa argus]|uniref:ecto-ADP-ribosyltransferase 4-like n=1 Tax=Channa argus TaxID=215402 RepID=UPI003523105D